MSSQRQRSRDKSPHIKRFRNQDIREVPRGSPFFFRLTVCGFITFIPLVFGFAHHLRSSCFDHHFVHRSLVVASRASVSRRLAHHCWFRFSLRLFRPPLLATGYVVHLELVASAHSFVARRHLITCDLVKIVDWAFPSCACFSSSSFT